MKRFRLDSEDDAVKESKEKNTRSLLPVRVRKEPPTLKEAIAAAQGLTNELGEQQVEIAAGLMGLTADEVRPSVLAAPPLGATRLSGPRRGSVGASLGHRAAGPVVVVERRSRSPIQAPGPFQSGRRPP